MDSQTVCRLLSLPPELRNRIYSYALEPEVSETWLLEAKKSNKDLLLTCKQIHIEASKMYTKAYRDFFTKTTFTVSVDDPEDIAELDWIEESDLEHITQIEITTVHRDMFKRPVIFNVTVESDEAPVLPWKITTQVNPSDVMLRLVLLDLELKRRDNISKWQHVLLDIRERTEDAGEITFKHSQEGRLARDRGDFEEAVEHFHHAQVWRARSENLKEKEKAHVTRKKTDLRSILKYCGGGGHRTMGLR